jgi:two-component system, NtrC family, sensor kinase
VPIEQIISESRRQWMGMLDAITDFIFLTDGDGTIVRTNRALATAFGKHPKELLGRKCEEFVNIDLPRVDGTEKETDLPLAVEKTINGETYLISSFPFFDNDKLLTVHVMKNVTRLERLREQLYYADKLTSLGLLVSGVAHEINNPLTGIIAYAELLRMRGLDRSIDDELQKILNSAERCKRIIENLMTFARQRTPSRTVELMSELIDRTIELRSHPLKTFNIEVTRDYGAMKSVFIDSQQMQQAILNVLLNAEQAIAVSEQQGGRIAVSTRYDGDADKVVIRISDNGPGIPKDLLPRIFDPFFTTKPVGIGTGLGLSIAHGIIAEHGGTLSVDSVEGEGTTFTIEIPARQPAAPDIGVTVTDARTGGGD